jgi:hypothetical protein
LERLLRRPNRIFLTTTETIDLEFGAWIYREVSNLGAVVNDEMELKMRAMIEQRNRARGRPLTAKEHLDNLTQAIGECDSDCASQRGIYCDCGAREFQAKFGPGKYTP